MSSWPSSVAVLLLASGAHAWQGPSAGAAVSQGVVGALTELVNLGAPVDASLVAPRRLTKVSPAALLAGLRGDFVEREYLWSGRITDELYADACVFTDPTLSFKGLATFKRNLAQLDPILERFAPPSQRRVELRSIRLQAAPALGVAGGGAKKGSVELTQPGLPAVVAEWRMVGDLALPWRPTLDLFGTTAFSYDPNEAAGRVVRYDESWAGGPLAALAQLLAPGPKEASRPGAAAADPAAAATARPATTAAANRNTLNPAADNRAAATAANVIAQPEHWPGRLVGAPPPKPLRAACLQPNEAAGVSVVVLPGFGNCAGDYVTPLGQPDEVGLVACLQRRGFTDVAVLEVERSDWFKVALGFKELAFWRGEATSGSAAFSWYTGRATAAIEAAQARAEARAALAAGPSGPSAARGGVGGGRVIVVGHSAGGWLARLTMLEADNRPGAAAPPEWAGRHVACLATLGAPHAPPPPDVDDMTRGVLRSLDRLAPSTACASQGVAYVTVAGDATDGDPLAPRGSAAQVAAGSYALVGGGNGAGTAGDGVVPLEAAHLAGANQVTLRGVVHSINAAGSGVPTDQWYGAEPAVDKWLPQVLAAYRTPAKRGGLPPSRAFGQGSPFGDQLARFLGRD